VVWFGIGNGLGRDGILGKKFGLATNASSSSAMLQV
jgi:hypothetical protein